MKGNLSTPINKIAALVTSHSKDNFRFDSEDKFDSDLPLPYYKSFYEYCADELDGQGNPLPQKSVKKIFNERKRLDITHLRRSRLVALGVSTERRGRFVCRCDCGRFTIRRVRCFFNDGFDACGECKKLDDRQRGFQ